MNSLDVYVAMAARPAAYGCLHLFREGQGRSLCGKANREGLPRGLAPSYLGRSLGAYICDLCCHGWGLRHRRMATVSRVTSAGARCPWPRLRVECPPWCQIVGPEQRSNEPRFVRHAGERAGVCRGPADHHWGCWS